MYSLDGSTGIVQIWNSLLVHVSRLHDSLSVLLAHHSSMNVNKGNKWAPALPHGSCSHSSGADLLFPKELCDSCLAKITSLHVWKACAVPFDLWSEAGLEPLCCSYLFPEKLTVTQQKARKSHYSTGGKPLPWCFIWTLSKNIAVKDLNHL